MKIISNTGTLLEQQADTYLIFMMKDNFENTRENATHQLDDAIGGQLKTIVEAGDFIGKQDSTLVLYPQSSDIIAKRIIVVGLGMVENFTADIAKRCVAVGMKKARELKAEEIATVTLGTGHGNWDAVESARIVTEGALLGLYQYHGQKSDDAPSNSIKTIKIATADHDRSKIEDGIKLGEAFAEGSILTRNLVNLPPNICTPDYMGQQARAMADQVGLKVDVLGEQQMQALKMGALLAVSRGSDTPPRFIIMEHNADKSSEYRTVVLIGKGVTFDTGGYSLKTCDGMVGMKGDMGGGGAVIGAMKTIAMLDLPIHVVGLVPTADNRVSGNAYLPQEVITASNGKTIEIISTDAEGRLLLADALVYAKRFEPSAVIDIATLTGSSLVALGAQASSLFCTDDDLAESLRQVGEAIGERVWRMPLYKEYFKTIESDTADMRNSAGRMSGVGSSAIFLKQFVDFDAWAHVDMAGLGSNAPQQKNPYVPGKTATGYGARLLAEYVQQLTL
jgi:leucyl aminopeptidase